MKHVQTLVIGAGPTGLGAGWRLHEHGDRDWLVVEQGATAGGAAGSVRDAAGFTWDLGGHVIHSHYPYFDRAVASCDVEWVFPQRNGYVYLDGAFVPVPLQQNLQDLGPELMARVQAELLAGGRSEPTDLAQWFRATFGDTLSDRFFEPFNGKMWAHPPRLLDHQWTSLRSGSAVANVPAPRLVAGGVRDRSSFPYPRHGSGALWSAVAAQLPPARLRYSTGVTAIYPASRIVQLRDGERLSYTNLLSSMPLTELLRLAHREPPRLLHSAVEVLGFGFDGEPPAALADKSWVYHPDPAVPFHRATMLSNYSQDMAGPGRWSILLECGTSAYRPLVPDRLPGECLSVLQTWGAGTPVSTWQRHLPMGYPLPSLGRDELLGPVLDDLQKLGIRSRGRFGGWRYESCNQDYAFMQGVQAVDAFSHGAAEDVFWPKRPAPLAHQGGIHPWLSPTRDDQEVTT